MLRSSTYCLLSDAFNICDGNNAVTFSAANRYVKALSDIICWGTDLREANPRYARAKVCIERSVTTTRWTTLVVAHVKKQMSSFFSTTASRMYKALVKSTSVTVNFSAWVSLFFGRRDGSGMLYGSPIIVLQVTQCLIAFLTCWRPAGIQYLRCTRFSVELAQEYNWLTYVSLMSNSVNGSLGGGKSNYLVDLETGAL